MAQTQKTDRVVILPLWITAVFDQLEPSELNAVENALDQLSRSADQRELNLLDDPDPDRHNGALFEMRVGADLRVLLVRPEGTAHYEVVGINRRAA